MPQKSQAKTASHPIYCLLSNDREMQNWTTSIGKNVEELEPLYVAGGNTKWCSCSGIVWSFFKKSNSKPYMIMWFSIPLLGMYPRDLKVRMYRVYRDEGGCIRRYFYIHVYSAHVRLRAGGEGNDRGWDGWMTSPTQWMWVRANSGRQWRTRKLGVFQSMGSQRVRHNWVTGPQLPSPPPSSES